jgi:hypothetical protein
MLAPSHEPGRVTLSTTSPFNAMVNSLAVMGFFVIGSVKCRAFTASPYFILSSPFVLVFQAFKEPVADMIQRFAKLQRVHQRLTATVGLVQPSKILAREQKHGDAPAAVGKPDLGQVRSITHMIGASKNAARLDRTH